jgi:type IV secretory pathway TraG/TraD family ATPase VirD4
MNYNNYIAILTLKRKMTVSERNKYTTLVLNWIKNPDDLGYSKIIEFLSCDIELKEKYLKLDLQEFYEVRNLFNDFPLELFLSYYTEKYLNNPLDFITPVAKYEYRLKEQTFFDTIFSPYPKELPKIIQTSKENLLGAFGILDVRNKFYELAKIPNSKDYYSIRYFKNYVEPNINKTYVDFSDKGFATSENIEKTLSKEKGFYVGGGYHFNDDGHLLTVGGSGAGKGVNFIVPALLSPALVASGSSLVVLDPKGENLAICGEHLKRNGYKLIVINPFDIPEIAGFGKARFNPLSLTSKNDINAPTFCDLIAECLISDDNQNDHWNDSARQYISLYLLYMVATEQANFKNLFEAVRLGGADRLEYLAKMKDCKAFDGIISATAGGVFNQIMSANGGNSNEIDSIFSTVRRGTEKFKNLQLRDHLKHSDFDLKTIAHEKTALFVCVNPSELKEFSPWLRVLFGCMFNSLKKHYNTKRRVLFLMDEFPQIGRLKEFQTAMVYMRGYNATLWVIVQDLGQLKQLYWDSWESCFGSA